MSKVHFGPPSFVGSVPLSPVHFERDDLPNVAHCHVDGVNFYLRGDMIVI